MRISNFVVRKTNSFEVKEVMTASGTFPQSSSISFSFILGSWARVRTVSKIDTMRNWTNPLSLFHRCKIFCFTCTVNLQFKFHKIIQNYELISIKYFLADWVLVQDLSNKINCTDRSTIFIACFSRVWFVSNFSYIFFFFLFQ